MLTNSLYDPETLSLLLQSQVRFKPELYFNKNQTLQERDVVIQILYMVSGLQTHLYVKKSDNAYMNCQFKYQSEEPCHFQLRSDIKVNFTHLSYQSIKQCSKIPLQIANFVLYLQTKTQLMYKKTQNIVLKAFCQGLMDFLIKFQKQNSQMLTKVQRQNGKVMWSTENKMIQQKEQQKQSYLTLMKISKYFEQKRQILKYLVGVISKLIPYMISKINGQYQRIDAYIAIQLLFNQFSTLVNQHFLSSQNFSQIVKIFSQSLNLYVGMIHDWLSMNPYQLQTKKQSGFFIRTQNINFSLSKSISYQSISLLKSRNRNNYMLKQNIHLNEDFVDRFFNFQALLVDEYMPKIFQKKARSILELGKIIQFIYLFYNPQQRPHLIQYFAISKQFQQILEFIQDYSNNKMNNRQNKKVGFFNKKKFKPMSIGEKLKNTKSKMMRFIQIKQDNPYQMYPTTRGVFVEQQNIAQKLNIPNRKTKTKLLNEELSQLQDSRQMSTSGKNKNFIYFFDKILGETVERIYQKALYFFYQKNSFKEQNSKSLINVNSTIFSKFNHIAVSNPSRILQSINTTLIGIKKFMLYEQGDFILEFINSVHNVFQNSYSKISKSLVHSLIEESIKSSSAKELPQQMKDNVTFMYVKKSNDLQIKHLKGWTVFSLLYKPPFPINCIFTDKFMGQFAQIFNFVLNIKKCEFYLKNIWDDFKQDGKIQTQYSLYKLRRHPFQSKILAIRNNIHHFVNSVFGYVMIQIEHYWDCYMKQLNISFMSNYNDFQQNPSILMDQTQTTSQKKILNPIDIIELTKKVLQDLKNQTVKNLTLTNTMLLIIELLDRFMKLQRIKVQSKQFNQILFSQDLSRIDHQFLGIMDMAKTIEGIGQTIEFNHQLY